MTADPAPQPVGESLTAGLRALPAGRGPAATTLICGDLAVVGGAVALAEVAGAVSVAPLLALGGGLLIGLRIASGLTPGFGLHPEARLRRAVLAWCGAAVTACAAAVLLSPPGLATLLLFLTGFFTLGLLQAMTAQILRGLMLRAEFWGEPVRLDGAPAAVAALQDYLDAHPETGFCPHDDPTVRKVLWADHALPSPERLARPDLAGAEVILVNDLPRLSLAGLHPAAQAGRFGTRLTPPRPGRANAVLKRGFDLCLALPIGLLSLPVVAIAAAGIRVFDPGPVFYVQPRDGRDGRTIGVLKLRTMYLDSDRMLRELLERDPAARAEWESHYKLRHDPRVLPVIGPLLRRSSLDELPQILNVLRGEMSLVGPRPFPDYHLAAMPPAFRSRRATVIPGLTGLWQISERSSADLAAQQQLDEFYIAGPSFWGDLSIFLRTFAAVFGRGGAY